jgi:hypothetical protein
MVNKHKRVKEIYDTYRTSLLNAKYYGCKLSSLRKYNFILEAIVAVGAAGSGVAGWQLWDAPGWKPVYLVIAATASLLAVLKPLSQISKQIETYSKLFGAHTSNSMALRRLVSEISSVEDVTEEHRQSYNTIYDRMIELAALDDPRPSKRLIQMFQNEVNIEVPPNSLWWPKREITTQDVEKQKKQPEPN